MLLLFTDQLLTEYMIYFITSYNTSTAQWICASTCFNKNDSFYILHYRQLITLNQIMQALNVWILNSNAIDVFLFVFSSLDWSVR